MLSAAKHLSSRHMNRWDTQMLSAAQHDIFYSSKFNISRN
jgi:hypothetical protein